MSRLKNWTDKPTIDKNAFIDEMNDDVLSVEVFRIGYPSTGRVGFDSEADDISALRVINVRLDENLTDRTTGFTDDTDVQVNDHWRYRTKSGLEVYLTVTDVIIAEYGSEVRLKRGR